MIGMARKLNDANKLQALSIPEIQHGIVNAAMRLERHVKFGGRKIKPGPLLNALVIHFLGQTEDEQERIAASSIAKLEAILASDDVVEIKPGSLSVPGRFEGLRGLGSVDLSPRKVKAKGKD